MVFGWSQSVFLQLIFVTMVFDRLNLISKVHELAEDYRAKSPLQKWNLFEKITSFILKASGVDIFVSDYKLIWLSFVGGILGFDCVVSIAYTTYYYRHNFMVALRALPWLSSISTVIYHSLSTRFFLIFQLICRL